MPRSDRQRLMASPACPAPMMIVVMLRIAVAPDAWDAKVHQPFVPAQAGTQATERKSCRVPWIPACAGMNGERLLHLDRDIGRVGHDVIDRRALLRLRDQ